MNKRLSALFLCSLVVAGTGNGLLSFLPVYASKLGATPTLVGAALAGIYLALVAGAVLTGRLAGAARRRRRLFVAAGLPGVPALALLGHVGALWQLTLLAAVVWFCGGGLHAPLTLFTGLYADPARPGRTFGLMSLALPTGAFLGGLAIGAAADRYGYRAM